MSSPYGLGVYELKAQTLKFPVMSSLGGLEKRSEEKRWSDAMAKPEKEVVRSERDSKMLSPTPLTPPKVEEIMRGWKKGLLAKDELGKENKTRPESAGLYDQDGFLKSSPLRSKDG